MLNIKQHGDILERTYYDKIIVSLTQYEELWKIFIGNNGSAKIIESDNKSTDEYRRFIAQHSYTILESLVCLLRISEKKLEIKALDDYLDANNDFILFQTHCGRIRDCVNKIGVKLKIDRLEYGLEDFYKRRNQVLHGKKLPFTIIEDMFVLPKVSGNEFNPNLWSDELLWEDLNPKEMEFVNDIYGELYNEMISCLNSIYSQILTEVKNNSVHSSLIEMMKNYQPNESNYITCSGITDNHFMSERLLTSASGSVMP